MWWGKTCHIYLSRTKGSALLEPGSPRLLSPLAVQLLNCMGWAASVLLQRLSFVNCQCSEQVLLCPWVGRKAKQKHPILRRAMF